MRNSPSRSPTFVNRDNELGTLRGLVHQTWPDGRDFPMVHIHGVGGVGKTEVVRELYRLISSEDSKGPAIMRYDFDIARSPDAGRTVLTDLAAQTTNVVFGTFGTRLAVLEARAGRLELPLAPDSSTAQKLLGTALSNWIPDKLGDLGRHLAGRLDVEDSVRRINGLDDLLHVQRMDTSSIYRDLPEAFVSDLARELPQSPRCRAIIWLDNHEALWGTSPPADSLASARLDSWITQLAWHCSRAKILVVTVGHRPLDWESDREAPPIHELRIDGLTRSASEDLFDAFAIASDQSKTGLRHSIFNACREQEGDTAHPLHLRLCIEIVRNTQAHGEMISPSEFRELPREDVSRSLADRFLLSLHDPAREQWIVDLAAPPRFDEQAALDNARYRGHGLGRSDLAAILSYPFIDRDQDGFYRFHRTLRRSLLDRVSTDLDAWWFKYWITRSDLSLVMYHGWRIEPRQAVTDLLVLASREPGFGIEDGRPQILDNASEVLSSEAGEVSPEDWAWSLTVLAGALTTHPGSPPAAALEAAVDAAASALSVFTVDEHPELWAASMTHLAQALLFLPTGDTASSQRAAAEGYAQVAAYRASQASDALTLARSYNNLGTSLFMRTDGDRATNIHQAIELYSMAATLFDETLQRDEWAMAVNNLGNALTSVPTGDHVTNHRNGLRSYREALEATDRTTHPEQWAMVMGNLGRALSEVPDQQHGTERSAVEILLATLEVYTEDEHPNEWARTMTNLAVAYDREVRFHVEGELSWVAFRERLDKGQAAAEAALRVYTPDAYPLDSIKTMAVLSGILEVAALDATNSDEERSTLRAQALSWAEKAESNLWRVEDARLTHQLRRSVRRLGGGDRDPESEPTHGQGSGPQLLE